MKLTTLFFIACLLASAYANPQTRGNADAFCAAGKVDDMNDCDPATDPTCGNALDGRLCRVPRAVTEDTHSEVIYHSGKHGDHAADIKFGDLLHDKIAQIQKEASPDPVDPAHRSREILLKCKIPGCTFNLAASVKITEAFKIRGEVKQGQRVNILLSSPFHIGTTATVEATTINNGDFTMESLNIVGSGKQSQSHIVIEGTLNSQADTGDVACFILFDKVAFKNHHVGFSKGGAIQIINTANTCNVDIINSRFVNNSAKFGGAIHMLRNVGVLGGLSVHNTHFIANAAIESGGAVYLEDPNQMNTGKQNCEVAAPMGTGVAVEDAAGNLDIDNDFLFVGCHFKDNTADKKGDTFIGRGGAIFAEKVVLQLRDCRTHGGNTAKFGNLIYSDNSCVGLLRFGCYEGPFNHVLNNDGYEGYGDGYTAYPTCSATSYDTYAPKEDIYARDQSKVLIEGVDLPGGVTCEESSASSHVQRHGCGSHIYAYHCEYGTDDFYVEAEDYDRDGFDCRYDCNDVWRTVHPAAGEQCNTTVALSLVRGGISSIYFQADVPLDSNCNGLNNEWVDIDGDHVPDWYDQCPFDYWKIVPGKCGCGYEDTEGCTQSAAAGECTTVEEGGVWYYMCEGDWWYWGDNDWTYGGTY